MRRFQFALGATLVALAFAASAQPVQRKGYIIELADAPAASYEGTVAGLAATRPASGAKLNVNASHVQTYLAYLNGQSLSVQAAIPAATVYHRYGVAFNGFAAKLTDAELQKLLASSGVKAITADEARQLDTNNTPTFLGISQPGGVWSQTDSLGRAIKGEDVIIAHIDGGVWPENPSFSDKVDALGKPVASHLPGTVVYGPPPARWTGICQTGLGFTAAMCNNKLIGARYFNAGWRAARTAAQEWSFEYIDSPRDADGHGSHTLSTSGGNQNVDVLVGGATAINGISGIAPRARVASYKTCYNGNLGPGVAPSGCFPSDSVAAINQAVADGADVINYSISGSQTSFRDAIETAFRNAAFAGVYVSASAGNGNVFPGNAPTAAHNSPWLMTVGNSTHDRYTEATVSLGSNGSVQGASFQTTGLSVRPLIWSRNAGFGAAAAQGSNQALCIGPADGQPALFDPALVAGKIVVCDRGTNALVNKVVNARAAGAVGVIILNTTAANNTTPLISAVLPTVHVPVSGFTAVTTEAAANGTAAFSGGVQVAGVVAPVMSNSSSRGPNQADLNVLKPDITGPGTDIIAAFANRGLTQAQRDAVAAGTLIPGPWADMISGTSMSSPHSAGLGALLKQANPTWSPYAIKSAIMSSASQSVKLANGAVDPNRWGFGAGHMNPNAALATNFVFDQSNADHLAYYNGTLSGSALNLVSMTAANVIGIQTFTRRLTNKGSTAGTFTASTNVPGFNTVVTPSTFTIAPGATQTFTVQVTRTTAAIGNWVFGEVVLSNGSQSLRSPVTVRPQSFVGVANITDTRNIGTKVFTVATGYTGTLVTTAIGLVPAQRLSGTVVTNALVCFPFTVPAGAKQLRAQMFNSETGGGAASDVDLLVRRAGVTVGSGLSGTSDELVIINNPTAATTYEACADGFAPSGGSAAFTINLWVVPSTVVPATLRAFGPSSVVTGGTASVGVSWNVPAGNRYLGLVEFRQTLADPLLSTTTVFIDNSAAVPVAVQAPLLRDKPLN